MVLTIQFNMVLTITFYGYCNKIEYGSYNNIFMVLTIQFNMVLTITFYGYCNKIEYGSYNNISYGFYNNIITK